jgi:hypothetical protein
MWPSGFTATSSSLSIKFDRPGPKDLQDDESGQNFELRATYFDVPPGGAFRLDAANPGTCGF